MCGTPGSVLVSDVRMILGCLWARRSRPAGVRVRAALAAAVFIVVSLLGVVHEATTAHVRCAVHGELVDSDALVDGDAPVGGVAGATRDTILHTQPQTHGHGDEHCLLAQAWRSSRIAPGAPALAAVVVVVGDARVVAPGVVPVPASLYLIAPKTSPPA